VEIAYSTYAVTLAFNPDTSLIQKIKSWIWQFDGIIIVDNGSDSVFVDAMNELVNIQNTITYIRNGWNMGVPAGYNIGIKAAILRGAYYVAIVDQDTVLDPGYRESMCQSFIQLTSEGEKIGAIAPKYVDFNTSASSKITLLKKFWFLRVDSIREGKKYQEVSLPIASGTMYNIDSFCSIGFFNEDYFVDHFETDFNLRLIQNRLRVYINTDCSIIHSLGERKIAKFMWIEFHPMGHPPLRKYYLYRNKLYLVYQYGMAYPSLIVFEILASLLDFVRILLFEDKKIQKFSMIVRGIYGFLRGEVGRFPIE
jgi:rhamnosyltransferase